MVQRQISWFKHWYCQVIYIIYRCLLGIINKIDTFERSVGKFISAPIIGEEYGLIGLTAIGGMFLLFLQFGLQATMRTKSRFEAILCTNLTILIVIHAFIGMLTSVGLLLPNGTGIPFLSYSKLDLFIGLGTAGLIFKILRRKNPLCNVLDIQYKKVITAFMLVLLLLLSQVVYFDLQGIGRYRSLLP